MLHCEQEAWSGGARRVAGVDEAGRGPLAGPVVAAAVVFDPDFLRTEASRSLAGLTDSKKLPPKRREFFYGLLQDCAGAEIGVAIVSVEEIDALNILRATHVAMARAVSKHQRTFAQIGGSIVVVAQHGHHVPHRAIVGGDAMSLSIAAASVVAKVTRDRLMVELAAKYPAYGFERHKGYGTREHLAALRQYGPSPIHRRSFEPVAQMTLGF